MRNGKWEMRNEMRDEKWEMSDGNEIARSEKRDKK